VPDCGVGVPAHGHRAREARQAGILVPGWVNRRSVGGVADEPSQLVDRRVRRRDVLVGRQLLRRLQMGLFTLFTCFCLLVVVYLGVAQGAALLGEGGGDGFAQAGGV